MIKKITLLLFIFSVTISFGQKTVIHTEDFENDGEGSDYKSNTFDDGANDFWLRSNTFPEAGSSNNQTYTGVTGSYGWSGEDIASTDNPLGTTENGYVVIKTLDISSYQSGEAYVSIDIAGELNGSGSWEAIDFFGIEYAFDTDIGAGGNSANGLPTAVNTGTYTRAGGFYGSGLPSPNNYLSEDEDGNGSGNGNNVINNTFTTYEFKFNIPPSAILLSVRVLADIDHGGEAISFDQVIVSASATVLNNELVNSSILNIYPNPVRDGKVFIQSPSSEIKNVEIYNILGRKVLDTKVVPGEEINVSSLSSGMYMLKITENNKTLTKKIVIQ